MLGLAAGGFVLLLVLAGIVFASGSSTPLSICVATKQGKAIVTPKNGACKTGYSPAEIEKEGPPGPEGKEGREGKEGPVAGSAVVDRIRSAGAIESAPGEISSSETGGNADPVTGGEWTQQAEEDEWLIAQAEVTPPAEACLTGGGHQPGEMELGIFFDGKAVGGIYYPAGDPIGTTVAVDWFAGRGFNGTLLGQSEPKHRTITVRAYDDCEGLHTRFKIDHVGVDVLSVH